MPQSSAISFIVIFVSGFLRRRFLSDCSSARFVICDIFSTSVCGKCINCIICDGKNQPPTDCSEMTENLIDKPSVTHYKPNNGISWSRRSVRPSCTNTSRRRLFGRMTPCFRISAWADTGCSALSRIYINQITVEFMEKSKVCVEARQSCYSNRSCQ